MTIAFSASATSGNLTVKGHNSCGDGTVSPNLSITVNPLPAAAGSISGSATVCKGQNGVGYAVGAIANATSYTWSYSGTGATITGVGNSVTIAFSASATSGNLTVRGVNSCGNGAASPNFAITVNDCTGPITSGVTVSPNPADGTPLPTVTASVSDSATGNSAIGALAIEYWSKGGPAFKGMSLKGNNDQSGDPQVDAMIEKARLELDPEKGRALLHDIQRYMGKAMWGLTMPGVTTEFSMAWPALANYRVWSTSSTSPYYRLWLDDAKPPVKKT